MENELKAIKAEYRQKFSNVMHEYAAAMLKKGIKIKSVEIVPEFIDASTLKSEEYFVGVVNIDEEIDFA